MVTRKRRGNFPRQRAEAVRFLDMAKQPDYVRSRPMLDVHVKRCPNLLE
jgi:hypothetical protein